MNYKEYMSGVHIALLASLLICVQTFKSVMFRLSTLAEILLVSWKYAVDSIFHLSNNVLCSNVLNILLPKQL